LGVSPRAKSRRLQRVLADFGCEQSFAKAAESLQEHYGFKLGASAARQATLCHAKRAKEQLEKEYEQPFRVLPAVQEEHLIAEVDGTMICTVPAGSRKRKKPREWKEMRLVAAQAKGSASAVYAATFGSVEETGKRWGHCAKQAGRGLNTRVHAVGDGAEWIRLQCQEVFGEQGHFLCDFYHVSEYLGAAAQTCRPNQPNQWRRTQQKRLRRGAAEKVIEALKECLEALHVPDEEAPVRGAHRYVSNRLECLDYPNADKLGLPIGSGMIESGHRHVLHSRLKKAGTAWLREHADDIAHLRVLRANKKWESFWN
jgi:hypothetical protein